MRDTGMKRDNDHSGAALGGRFGLLILILTLVAIGCGGNRDDRDNIRSSRGEPDDIQFTEGPVSDWEIWTYFDYPDVGWNHEYMFEKARNACGGSGNWVLTREHSYQPSLGGRGQGVTVVPGVTDPSNPIKP